MPLETVSADGHVDMTRVRPKAEVATGYVRFQDGDILVPKVAPTFQAGRATVVSHLEHGAGAGSTELHVLRAREGVDPRYICYVTRSLPFLSEGVSSFQGVAGLQRVSGQFLRDFPVLHFSLGEQRRIADFLDDQVALLDEAVRLRRKGTGLMSERLASVVEEAMWAAGRESPRGTPWIPNCERDERPARARGDYVGGAGVPFFRSANLDKESLEPKLDNLARAQVPAGYEPEAARASVASGDVLVGITGANAGWVTHVRHPGGSLGRSSSARRAHPSGPDPSGFTVARTLAQE